MSAISCTTLSAQKLAFWSDDVFVDDTAAVKTDDHLQWPSVNNAQLLRCGLLSIAGVSAIHAAWSQCNGTQWHMGVIRFNGGRSAFAAVANGTAYVTKKLTGQPGAPNMAVDWPGRAAHLSYRAQNSVMTVRLHGPRVWSVAINGVQVTAPQLTEGDITAAGFGTMKASDPVGDVTASYWSTE